MRLLVMDFIRRRKYFYGFVCLYFAAFGSATIGIGMGLSIGTMFAPGFNSREILALPLSRKEIWRARWILALIPAVLGAVIRLLVVGSAMAISSKTGGSVSWILQLSSFQLIYMGTIFAAYIPFSYCTQKSASPVASLLIGGHLLIAAIVLEVFLENKLPRNWHELTGGTIFMLVVGLCVSAIAFFHSPRLAPRRIAPLAIAGERSKRSSSTSKPDLKTRYMHTGRTSLNLLVWGQIRTVLFAAFVCGTASQLPIIIAGWWEPQRLSMLERGTVFAGPMSAGAASLFAIPILFAAIWILMATDLLGLRFLRVLPVTTSTLAAMLTLIPVLFWLTFWSFPLATYWILAGHLPPTFRLELLAGLTGLTCLATSAALHAWVKGPAPFVVLPLLSSAGFIALHFYGKPLGSTATALIGILGLAGVAVSFVLNDRALQLNGSAYTSKVRLPGIGRPRWIVQ